MRPTKSPFQPILTELRWLRPLQAAALRDRLRILGHRYPLAEVSYCPSGFQGTEAPGEIAAAIDYANQFHVADLMIVGRGGGSIEDLWAFNEEVVARAIYRSENSDHLCGGT